MKAVRCHLFGSPEKLSFDEVSELSGPGENEVIISVKAAGVNFPDTLIIQGKYQFQPEFPFVPGGEAAGVVKSVGSGVDFLQKGDRVLAGTGWGSFAEEVIAPASNTFKIPNSVGYQEAAILAEAYGTSYHALVDRAKIKKGETLLVLGASGGVGIAAVQIGKALGATVIAAASSEEKLAFCKNNGADHLINYSQANVKEKAKEITGGKGVDVVYDPVGGDLTEPALRSIAWNGRYLVVGFAAGSIPKIPLNLPLLKGCSIIGVFWGGFFRKEPEENRKNFIELIKLLEKGAINPPIHEVFKLADAGAALREIMERKVIGKIVLSVEDV